MLNEESAPEMRLVQNAPDAQPELAPGTGRLTSLDFLRGFIMVILALESTGLFDQLMHYTRSPFFRHVWSQFEHHPWHGLRFWDLIQPGFMFVAGTAMAFSLNKQRTLGASWRQSFFKMLKRCWWLLFWGIVDYAVRPGGLSFELWDVLAQLSFTLMVAFLIFRFPIVLQLGISIGLLLMTEALYRFSHVPGFDQPFTDQHNFGNYVDLLLMHKINPGGWVAINCIPTAAHTIWGSVAGIIILSNRPQSRKLMLVLFMAAAAAICGYGLDVLGITPIIKRIATSSFTFASGGYCLAALAACYWWIDVRQHRKHLEFFTVVGMNSIFIYLFFEIVGHRWFNGYVTALAGGLMQILHVPDFPRAVVACLCIFGLEWYLCYWLYRHKLFFKV